MSLKDHMTPTQRASMKNLPTYHSICFAKTGVMRPGKTARERAKDRAKEDARAKKAS
jgi:hypothetical protein